jgi:translocation and assembly module TamB
LSTVPLSPDYYDRPQPPRPPRRRWKRIAAWSLGGLIVLVIALLIGLVSLLHNNGFRQYVLRIARTKLSEAMEVDLRMSDFSVHLSGLSPSVDMYDVVVDGAAPYQTPPLLQVDHLSVGVQIVSLLSRKWYLKDIVADHPVAHVFVGPNGETNLPKPNSSGQISVFDLGIRQVTLGQGEVYYNDRQSRLDADLHDFEFQSSFDPGPKRYSGGLSYKDGKIHFQDLNPMIHSFEAQFEATPDTFTLKRSTLTSGASQFSLAATLNDYAHPKVSATYQSSLDTGELRQILKDATLTAGVVKLAGSARFESDPNKPVIQTVTVDGNMTSDRLQIRTTTINTLVRGISARYHLQNGDAAVHDLRALVLGGGLDGSLKMHDVTGAQISELHAALHNVSLASVQELVNAQEMKDLRLTGTANATVDAGWRKTFDTLVAKTDVEFNGMVTRLTTPAARSAQPPLLYEEGSVHAKYSAAAQEVSFDRSYIRLPQTNINLNGTVSKTASLQVQVQSNDLSEIETAADVFGANLQPLGLGGSGTFTGTVRGSTTTPQIAGQLSASALKVKGTEWRTVRTAVDANPSHVALRNGEIVPATNQGRMTFNLNLGLDHWTFRETSPFQIDVNAAQLNIADLKNLAGVKAPVTGTLSANISLQGSESSPMGGGHVTLTQAIVSDEPIQSANIDFHGTGDELRTKMSLRMPAGSAQANITYFPKRKAYEGQLQTAGFRLDQVRTLRARNLNLTGTLNLDAQGSGTLDNPGVRLTARIPQLRIQDQQINALMLQADVSNHVANVSLDSQSQALNAFIKGRGRVNLTGLYETDATLDTASIPLQPLFATYLPAQASNLTGQTELHATVRGPLKDTSRLDAHLTIPSLALSLRNNVQLAAVQPIRLDYSRGVLNLQRTEIRGTKTDLQLQGTIPLAATAPMTIVALGTIDLSLAQMLDPNITSSGQIQFNIDGMGRRTNPEVQGQVKIVNAAFAGDDLPIGLQNGNGVLVLTNDRLDIRQFEGNVSGGTVTAAGAITYRPAMQFNVAVTGTGIRTLFPEGVREGISTNLSLVGTRNYALLRGQVRLTEVSFSPAFDLGDILGAVGGTAGSAAPPGGFAQNLHLNVNVVSTSDLNLSSSKLSLQGAANLRVGGTAAQPTMLGRVNLTGGDLIFRGNRYLLQPSTLDFVDPYQIQPRVNLAVDTSVQQYNIHMLFRGTVDRLRTTYTSEPALPPSDIINLLVFGKTSAEQAANATPGTLGAESMIASSVSSQITGRVEKIAGISQLSVDPVLGGNGQDPGARVTVQQRVTGNLFVTFATDATSTQREVIKLEYQATPRVGLSGVRDQNGGFAFDVRIKKTW